MYTLTAVAYLPSALRARRSEPRGLPVRHSALLKVALIYVGTTTLTKTSLRYIDMPTQTVLKVRVRQLAATRALHGDASSQLLPTLLVRAVRSRPSCSQ